MKIVVNKCYGGFGVSEEFCKHYDIPYKVFNGSVITLEDVSRTDERLIEFIEKFGSKRASGQFSKLEVDEAPKGCLYQIDAYDGYETLYCKDLGNWKIAMD